MKKPFEQLEQEITEKFINSKYKGISVTEDILTEICGQDVSLYDSFFGDKVDCEYIICDCFTTADNKMSIKINYGERTMDIGYVSVTE
jgi:hypothetical protein